MLHEQRCRTGQTKKKKRKYIYYDHLSFLEPVISHRAIEVGAFDFVSVLSDDTDIIETMDSDDNAEEDKYDEGLKKKLPEAVKWFLANESRTLTDEMKIRDEKNEIVYGEDISFAEMLVPILRKLTDDQKHYAKTQILKILQNAKEL